MLIFDFFYHLQLGEVFDFVVVKCSLRLHLNQAKLQTSLSK